MSIAQLQGRQAMLTTTTTAAPSNDHGVLVAIQFNTRIAQCG